MRSIILIVLIWVIALLAMRAWQLFWQSSATFQMEQQTEQYNEDLRKAVAE